MRLHRLRITAFGPFSGTEEIDFDALSDAGLFLVQGRTGAGKTSILDAVCFALYGQVPGARNAAKGLRSDHAAPGTGPSVVLETTIRGRRLRITRSPAWERPKLRGTGTTAEHAKVILEELEDGTWVGLTTRLDEAGDLVSRLLGMTAVQFCQVALLPQGEFAGFLRAGADERRRVLERLFATEVFTQVEKWLADRRAASGREAAELGAAASSIAGRIAETTGAPSPLGERPAVPAPRRPEPAPEPAADIEALPAWAAELAAGHADVRAVTAELRQEVKTQLEAARRALEDARALTDRQRGHADALARRDALRAHAEEKSRMASRLYAAERAGRAVPLVHAVQARHAEARRARRWADEKRAEAGALLPPNASEDVLVKAERARRDEIAKLERARGEVARLRQVEDERAALARELAELEPREARLAATLAELPGIVAARRTELEAANIAAAGRPGAEAAVQEAGRRLDAAHRRDQLEHRLAEAEAGYRSAVDAAQAAKERVLDLRQVRLDGMASVLAGELRDGEPCRVCGSTEHPDPGAPSGDIPDEAEIERAQAEADEAQEARERAGTALEGLRSERDHALETAGEADAETIAGELEEAELALQAVNARAAEAERLEGALLRDEQELENVREEHEAVSRDLAANRARDPDLAVEQARLSAELDEARGEDATIEARIARLGREAGVLAATIEALRESDRAAAELAAARENARAAAEAEGFRTPEEVLDAALRDEEQGALRDKIRRLDNEEAAVRDRLEDPALVKAAAEPAPDLPALEAALAAAEAAHTGAASAADRARLRRDRLADLRAELGEAVGAWRPAAERHEVAERLAGLTSGKHAANRHAMSLSAYVLAARLEQVVAAANERLSRMSGGRYALIHTTEKAAGDRTRGAGGLGLRIADAWTGMERDPVTLSGGESFITSLSLALGLADVVTAEAGGTEIGTLFVDEGFGTLDEETLDEVMDVLDGLRDGGRAVGVVSHVAELRARIPAQLRVTKDRAGSTAMVTV
ncbi:AAA family ATPase [Actinomadura livida]|uniref:Nuclease SbcCD subunit C n=1 Tax=Actinomadura livida TaxID=79909 RepID=A0A7W7IC18_9ACTN|nr:MULTISPECIES: SMC family ATPase [Actinomadura]MBB4774326.1 exonuclease SbcC [Actinomadura catellatispora]GGT83372.1 nuclease SbcCD subunit C [Actinomadura livida]